MLASQASKTRSFFVQDYFKSRRQVLSAFCASFSSEGTALTLVFPGHDIVEIFQDINPHLSVVQASSHRLLENFPSVANLPRAGKERFAVDCELGEMRLRTRSRLGLHHAIGKGLRLNSVADIISNLRALQMIFIDASSNDAELIAKISPKAFTRGTPICVEAEDSEYMGRIVRLAVDRGFEVFAIETVRGRVVQMPAAEVQPGILLLIPSHAWSSTRLKLLAQLGSEKIHTFRGKSLIVPAQKALPIEVERCLIFVADGPSRSVQKKNYFLPSCSHVLGDFCDFVCLGEKAEYCIKATGDNIQLSFIPPRLGEFGVRLNLDGQPSEPLVCFIDSVSIRTQWVSDTHQLVLLDNLRSTRIGVPIVLKFECANSSAVLGFVLKGIELVYTADPVAPPAVTN